MLLCDVGTQSQWAKRVVSGLVADHPQSFRYGDTYLLIAESLFNMCLRGDIASDNTDYFTDSMIKK